MAAKRSSAKGKNVPRKGKAARGSKKSARKERSEENKETFKRAQVLARDSRPGWRGYRAKREVTDEDVEIVLEAVADGDTVNAKCRELGVSPGTVRTRITADEQLSIRYARAKQMQAHSFVEQNIEDAEALLEIDPSDDGANVEVQIAKHLFEVRKWTSGKYHVGAYGDKVTTVLEGNPDKPVETINRTMSQEEQMRLYAEERDKKS